MPGRRPQGGHLRGGHRLARGQGGTGRARPAHGGNSWLYGDEWANNGTTEPYTDAARYAREALAWAVLQECQEPRVLLLHRTWAPGRKTDPTYDLDEHRTRVAALGARLAAGTTGLVVQPPAPAPNEEDVMRPEERCGWPRPGPVAKATDTRVVQLTQQVEQLMREVQALRNGPPPAADAAIPASR